MYQMTVTDFYKKEINNCINEFFNTNYIYPAILIKKINPGFVDLSFELVDSFYMPIVFLDAPPIGENETITFHSEFTVFSMTDFFSPEVTSYGIESILEHSISEFEKTLGLFVKINSIYSSYIKLSVGLDDKGNCFALFEENKIAYAEGSRFICPIPIKTKSFQDIIVRCV